MSAETPEILHFPTKSQKPIVFDRRELGLIMGLYGRYVASGDWRDYALSFGKETARFDIHRHTSEQPLYSVIKNPALRDKGGLFQVIAPGGLIMRRGNELDQVLKVLEKKPKFAAV